MAEEVPRCASLDGEGLVSEGTGQSLRVASRHAVAVLNLAREEHALLLRELIAAP